MFKIYNSACLVAAALSLHCGAKAQENIKSDAVIGSANVIEINNQLVWKNVLDYIQIKHDPNADVILMRNLIGVRIYNAGWQNEYYNSDNKPKMISVSFEVSGKMILSDEVRELFDAKNITKRVTVQCDIPGAANMIIVHAELLKLASTGSVADLLILTKDDDKVRRLKLPQNDHQGELDFHDHDSGRRQTIPPK